MVFPIIPVAAASAIVLGGITLVWYSHLTPDEKEAADLRANELAQEWYGVALDKLNKFKFLRVILAVKREFTGKQDDDPVGAELSARSPREFLQSSNTFRIQTNRARPLVGKR